LSEYKGCSDVACYVTTIIQKSIHGQNITKTRIVGIDDTVYHSGDPSSRFRGIQDDSGVIASNPDRRFFPPLSDRLRVILSAAKDLHGGGQDSPKIILRPNPSGEVNNPMSV